MIDDLSAADRAAALPSEPQGGVLVGITIQQEICGAVVSDLPRSAQMSIAPLLGVLSH